VRSQQPVLDRHQRPGDENFCLDREDAPWWTPQHTAADLLIHLQSLMEAERQGTVAQYEADMPEPITGQLPYSRDEIVVVPQALLDGILPASSGTLEIVRNPHNRQLWVVHRLLADGCAAQEVVSKDKRERIGLASNIESAKASWRAVQIPPGRPGVERAVEELLATLNQAAVTVARRAGKKINRRTVWAAITFAEEGPRRGEEQRAWVFAQVVVGTQVRADQKTPRLLATQALSPQTRRLRTRELRGLEKARFLVIGAGSVGSHAAVELARAGVGALEIVDDDHYDLNNSVRHVLPISYAGREKADAVADFARGCSPFTKARGHMFSAGSTENAKHRLLELIRQSNVVIDATGSANVTRLLHWRCAQAGVPLVSGALSPGGLGGRIVILRKRRPCLDCFYTDPAVPPRDSARAANTTPYGCSHPAASCAPFEVTELAANLARSAARCVPRLAYPPADFDWAVINFRRNADRWTQGLLVPQPDCPACSNGS
jgi:molybdopterin/thiamine biosynthesis adenylyltransferase